MKKHFYLRSMLGKIKMLWACNKNKQNGIKYLYDMLFTVALDENALSWWMDFILILIFSLCCFYDFAENQNTAAVCHVLHLPFNVGYGWKQKQWGRGGALLYQQLCDGVQNPGCQCIRYWTVILTRRLLFVFVLLFLSLFLSIIRFQLSVNQVTLSFLVMFH